MEIVESDLAVPKRYIRCHMTCGTDLGSMCVIIVDVKTTRTLLKQQPLDVRGGINEEYYEPMFILHAPSLILTQRKIKKLDKLQRKVLT